MSTRQRASEDPAEAGGDGVRRILRARHLGYVASAAIVAWLLLVVLPEVGNLDDAGRLLLDHLDLLDVLIVGGLLAAYLVTHGLTITTAAPEVTLPAAIRVRAVTGGISRLVPAGWVAGTGVTATMLRRLGLRGEAITHAIAVTGVWNSVTKLLLPLVGVLAVAVGGASPLARSWEVGALGVGGVGVVAGGLWVLTRPSVGRRTARWVERPVAAVARRLGRSAPTDLPEQAVALQASTAQALRRRPVGMALWYLAHHLSQAALVYVGMRIAARGAGMEVGAAEVLAAFAIGYLLTGLPISPGGLGTMDVALVVVLTGLGEQAAVASAGLAVYRVATYGFYVAVLVTWPLWRPGATPPPRHISR